MPYFIGFETTSEWVDLIILLIGISLIIQSDDNSGVQNFFLINNLSSFRPTSCWHTSLPVQSSTLEIMKFFLPSGRMCDYVAQCVHVLVTIMLKNAKSLRTSAQRDRQTGKQMLGVIQIDLLNLNCTFSTAPQTSYSTTVDATTQCNQTGIEPIQRKPLEITDWMLCDSHSRSPRSH